MPELRGKEATKKLRHLSTYTKIGVQSIMFVSIVILPKFFPAFKFDHIFELTIVLLVALFTSVVYEIITEWLEKRGKNYQFLLTLQLITSVILLTFFLHYFGNINGPLFILYGLTLMESSLNLNTTISIVVLGIMCFATAGEWTLLVVNSQIQASITNIVYLIVRILSLLLLMNYGRSLAKTVLAEREAKSDLEKLAKNLETANIQIGLADKVKHDLLTMASHEFRTPTSVITSALWFLNREDTKKRLNSIENQNLQRIIETMDRLNYVVNNISQMLQTAGGELALELAPVQLEILIKEVIEDKQIEANEKQINFKYDEQTNLLPMVLADKVKMKYVLWELLSNALKYTKKDGVITVTNNLVNNNVEIKISDTGEGIPEENIPKLFEGFSKIDVMHTTQPGMGLGLYVVKKIIDLHQGNIKVESVVGKGTTFTISIPIKALTDIKPDNKVIVPDTPKVSGIPAASYGNSDDNKLPHPLEVVKCIIVFQLTLGAIFAGLPHNLI